jgi:uncharacterized membrane protein YfcA
MVTFDLQRVREKAVSADLVGYEVEDLQGTIGEVDHTTEELVPSFISVDTVSSLPGKHVTLPAAVIERIDHGARKVYVDRRHEEIRNAPQPSTDGTDRRDGNLGELRHYYGPGGEGYRAPRGAWTEAFSSALGGDRIDEAARRQRDKPIRERMRLPGTGVRDLVLAASVYVVGFVVLMLLIHVVSSKPAHVDLADIIVVALLALFFETVDSSAGMGFGTALSPLLLVIGFKPLQVVPVLVASQAFTSAFGGVMHSEFANVEFSLRPLNRPMKTVLLVAIPGAVGACLAVVLTYFALKLPDTFIETYIAVLVLAMATLIGATALRRSRRDYRPQWLPFFGAVAGVNKGIGSGGYGPVITLGGVICGVLEKTSVAITTMAEGIASTVGAATFLVIAALGTAVDWRLLPWLWLGAFPASVLGPYTVRVLPVHVWRYFVPFYATAIATVLLVQTHGA